MMKIKTYKIKKSCSDIFSGRCGTSLSRIISKAFETLVLRLGLMTVTGQVGFPKIVVKLAVRGMHEALLIALPVQVVHRSGRSI